MCICYGHARSCPLDEITKVFFDLIDLFLQNNLSDLKRSLPKNGKEKAKILHNAYKLFAIIFFLFFVSISGSLVI